MAKFQLDDYFWKLLKSHQIIRKNPLITFQDLYEKFTLKFMCDAIFPLFPN